MSRFLEVYKPVEEGWGTAFVQIGTILGLGTLLVNPMVGVAATGVVALVNGQLTSKAQKAMNQILNNPKVKAYIKSECDKAFKAVKTKYGNKFTVSKNVNKDDITTQDITTNGEMKHAGIKHVISDATIAGYCLSVYGDTDHVNAMNVAFKITNNSTGKTTIGLHAIPSPTRDDIKKMGFHEE